MNSLIEVLEHIRNLHYEDFYMISDLKDGVLYDFDELTQISSFDRGSYGWEYDDYSNICIYSEIPGLTRFYLQFKIGN